MWLFLSVSGPKVRVAKPGAHSKVGTKLPVILEEDAEQVLAVCRCESRLEYQLSIETVHLLPPERHSESPRYCRKCSWVLLSGR